MMHETFGEELPGLHPLVAGLNQLTRP